MKITTIYADPSKGDDGLRDESAFEKREGVVDNDNEYTTWVEYWDGTMLVHRSANIRLKKGLSLVGEAGDFQ